MAVVTHYEGWTHFTEGRDDILRAFAEAGLSGRLHLLEPGQSTAENTFTAAVMRAELYCRLASHSIAAPCGIQEGSSDLTTLGSGFL
jgi:hypothetical protein